MGVFFILTGSVNHRDVASSRDFSECITQTFGWLYQEMQEYRKVGNEEALQSYLEVLQVPQGSPFGPYCSACTPIWFTEAGDLGIGPNPRPSPGKGLWHGRWPRVFYPKGK